MEFMKKVEEISKKVGDTASNTYNTVADKSGKLIEETKLKISISDKETDIDEIYDIQIRRRCWKRIYKTK